tara:strand:- start:260 stop:1402 length:1143 start_codon:yes stop_codon:yes gene_type:complete
MKIAFDFVATNLGSGTKTYIINFCNKINKLNKNTEIFIFICKNYLKEIDSSIQSSPNVKLIIKPDYLSITFFRIIWMQLVLPFELKYLKIKNLYSPMNLSPILNKILNISNILVLHSNLPWKYFNLMPGNYLRNLFTKKLMELSVLNSKILIVDSDFAKAEIKSILNLKEKKIFKVYLGINEKYFENKESSDFIESFNYHESYILSVLSCVKYHNIINLLKAYKMLLNDISSPPKFCLVLQILDKKYYYEIKNFIKKNFDKNRVKILINIENKYLKNLYKFAKIYMFTSYSEVFGLTSLEAMSQNCPILISNRSALPEINGDAADYFDPDNIEEIKDKIKELFLNNSRQQDLIKKGYLKSRFYTWEKNLDETLIILDNYL